MPNRTFRVRDGKGNWTEIDPQSVVRNPILHESLDPDLLERIRSVYDVLRDVITLHDQPMSLEAFELGFMREVDPEAELKTWGAIARAYAKACGMFPDDRYTRSQIYHWLILLIMGAVSDEELQKEEVKLIRRCFLSEFPS